MIYNNSKSLVKSKLNDVCLFFQFIFFHNGCVIDFICENTFSIVIGIIIDEKDIFDLFQKKHFSIDKLSHDCKEYEEDVCQTTNLTQH